MTEFLLILVSTVFVNNYVLAKFLGVCPFLGVSKKVETSLGMTYAVMFVMTLASVISWLVQHYILNPFGLGYLQTISFILIIASLVQLTEMVIHKTSPILYASLGIFLPLITTNCAILAVALFQTNRDYNLIESLVFALGAGLGFMLALLLMAGLREKLALATVPQLVQGTAATLMIAGILSLTFMGFAGLGT